MAALWKLELADMAVVHLAWEQWVCSMEWQR